MTDKILLIIDAALAAGSIGLTLYALYTLRRVGRIRSTFADQSKPVDMEDILSTLALKIELLERDSKMLADRGKSLRHHTGMTIQKVGLVRFNSFADEGGNLSFCCVLLDEHDNGVILTSMHGRQQNRIYAKTIISGVSETPLSGEERQAIKLADQAWQEKINTQLVKKPKSKVVKRS